MIWRFLVLPLGLSLLLLVLAIIGVGSISARENKYFESLQDLQVQLIRAELQGLFQSIQDDINTVRDRYYDIHRQAQYKIATNGSDLISLQSALVADFGLDIDLFIISPELVIVDTTFEPDMGLDFNAPFFKDAQAAFSRVKNTQHIDVSPLTRELASGVFKVYTLSQLQSGGFLQLGFIDPSLPSKFEQAEAQLAALETIENVRIYHDAAGALLMPLTSRSSLTQDEYIDKALLVKKIQSELAGEMVHFSKVDGHNTLVLESTEPRSRLDLYIELSRYRVDEHNDFRFLAKVETNLLKPSWWRQNFSLLSSLVVISGFVLLWFLLSSLRHSVLLPLSQLRNSILTGRELDISNSNNTPDEIRYLINAFNKFISRSKHQSAELRERSIRDPLTGLLNRLEMANLFSESKRIFKRDGLEMGVAFIDLDHFKSYNDIYGHLSGDKALIKFAACVQAVFKRPTDRVFRYGGEEFVVIFGSRSELDAIELVETLRDDFEQLQIVHSGNPPFSFLTLSCGVVLVSPDKHFDLSDVLIQADQQLYSSKSSDRNCVTFIKLDE